MGNDDYKKEKEKQDISKSKVRVRITYWAAGFLFLTPIILIIYQLSCKKYDEANKIFMSILPIASTIVGYWFAKRGSGLEKKPPPPP